MIGFGNPLLDGPDERYEPLASEARGKAHLHRAPANRKRPLRSTQRAAAECRNSRCAAAWPMRHLAQGAAAARNRGRAVRGGRAISAPLRTMSIWARVPPRRQVKRLSKTGELAQYRIVHFATHGALAGQVRGNAEPGLLFTPPDTPSEEDDGYLTASEIAGLKLDADWVILSACNTAAGGAQGAEALSGLARAFIYAQARALLVSHWEVNSDATVKLITGAMSRLAANKSMGRAEAMRQSMLALIDKGEPREAHPAYLGTVRRRGRRRSREIVHFRCCPAGADTFWRGPV